MNLPMPSDKNSYESTILGFAREAISEADNFLKAQKGYSKIQESIDAIMGDQAELRTDRLSSTAANHIGKIALDLAAGMTDVRPFMEFMTQNPAYEPQVRNFKNLGEHWWYKRSADLRLTDIIKYAEVAGTGYAHLAWDTDLLDITCTPEDPRDVLPIRPSGNITLQDAAGVCIRRQRTVNFLRSIWPESKWDKIVAEKEGSFLSALANTSAGKLLERATAGLSPFHDALFGNKAKDHLPRIPTCDYFTMYLRDDRIHEGATPLFMGAFNDDGTPKNNWSYVVHKGEPVYPNKRLLIFTNHGVLYDGPSLYWHGLYPVCKLTLDPYPWLWLGKGVIWDLLTLNRSLDKALQFWDDWLQKLRRPDVIADKNSISKAALEKIDTSRAGLKLMQNPLAGKGIQFVPAGAIPQDFWKGVQFLIDEMNELSGVANIQALMRLNQVPSSDTIEQIADKMSPSVRLRSKMVEGFIREFATMLAYDFLQFYTLPMRLHILGAQGMTAEDANPQQADLARYFDPGSMVPNYLGNDYGPDGNLTPEALMRGKPRDRMHRAKEMMEHIEFYVAPGSLLAQSDVTEQMKYIQLYRMQAMPLWDMLDRLKISDIGPKPEGNLIERLAAQMQAGLGPDVSPVGRKASGQSLPSQKSSGAISESG